MEPWSYVKPLHKLHKHTAISPAPVPGGVPIFLLPTRSSGTVGGRAESGALTCPGQTLATATDQVGPVPAILFFRSYWQYSAHLPTLFNPPLPYSTPSHPLHWVYLYQQVSVTQLTQAGCLFYPTSVLAPCTATKHFTVLLWQLALAEHVFCQCSPW